jgi:hypothetical protein
MRKKYIYDDVVISDYIIRLDRYLCFTHIEHLCITVVLLNDGVKLFKLTNHFIFNETREARRKYLENVENCSITFARKAFARRILAIRANVFYKSVKACGLELLNFKMQLFRRS